MKDEEEKRIEEDKDEEKEEEEFKTMVKGKALGAREMEAKKIEDELRRLRNRERNNRRRPQLNQKNSGKFRQTINRFDPYTSATRKLIQTSSRHSGESASTSGNVDLGEEPGTSKAVPNGAPSSGGNTADPDLTLLVTRTDRRLLTREDVFHIHAEIAIAEVNLLEAVDNNPHDISCAKRDRHGRGYSLTCNTLTALSFYQKAIESQKDNLPADHTGFTCFKPGERPPGHRIMGKIFLAHRKLMDKIHLAFAAGSCGAVNRNQVSIYRPGKLSSDNPMLQVYLELDEEAFSWLRSLNWTSRIGGSSVTWRAPGIPGLTGVYKPDEDLHAIKAEMVATLNSITPQTRDPNNPWEFKDLNQVAPTPSDSPLALLASLELNSTTETELSISGEDVHNTTITQTEMDMMEDNTPHSTPIKDIREKTPTPRSSPQEHSPKRKIARSRHDSNVSDSINDPSLQKPLIPNISDSSSS